MSRWSVSVFSYIFTAEMGEFVKCIMVLKHWQDPSFLLLLGSLLTLWRSNFSYFTRRGSGGARAYVGILPTEVIIFGCKSFGCFHFYFMLYLFSPISSCHIIFSPLIWIELSQLLLLVFVLFQIVNGNFSEIVQGMYVSAHDSKWWVLKHKLLVPHLSD